MATSAEAMEALQRSGELIDQRRFAEAVPHAEAASRLAPDWYLPHLHLGVCCKHTGDFRRSLAGSLRAMDLDPEASAGAGPWNAGIAATALGDWARARWAWARAGIELPPGTGPLDLDLGPTPVRVCGHEVVWCQRLDPARARIESIPSAPERRHGDLLLHDGEPRGQRALGDQLCSVFDELAVLERSPYLTWKVTVTVPAREDLEALEAAFRQGGEALVEDWTGSLQVLCKACSEGTPHEHHRPPEGPWKPERTVAFAAREQGAGLAPLVAWAAGGRGRRAAKPERVTPA